MESSFSLAPPEPDEFLANQAFLRRLARALVHDAGRAEDLVQETFAVWAERRPRGLSVPRAWLARVLQNRARNAQREEERRARRERAAARPEALDAGESTLELQAQVVAVLHGLDEPLRNALLLRYFHELAPSEIAERTGAPLNTVKDRLARGLARMRAELDRRHRHDRGAWIQWLLPPAVRGSGLELAARAGAVHALAPGGPSWLALACGGCALLALGAVICFSWPRPVVETGVTLAPAAPEPDAVELRAPLVPAPVPSSEGLESPPAGAARVAVLPSPAAPSASPIEWPHYARNSAHDGFDPLLRDLIRTPAVLWHVEGCVGQPTLSGGDLYSGGRGLVRIDPRSGAVLARALVPEEGGPGVGEAPAIAGGLVLARRMEDGGVTAFDRALASEVWSWTPAYPRGGALAGCLADELYLVAHGPNVIALRVFDGSEAWRFTSQAGGDVSMTPAVADGRVLFGAEGGTFFAVSVVDGRELWRADTGGWLGWTNPVVVGDRVVFGDRGHARAAGGVPSSATDRRGQVRALALRDGNELWETDFGATGFSTPGVGRGFVVAGYGSSVSRFDLEDGRIDAPRNIRTGKNAFGSPTVVGQSLVFGNLDGNLYVHALDDGRLRWRFHLPRKQVHAFVHAGERIYVSSSAGLFCLGDAGTGNVPDGFVLSWEESPK